MVGLRTCFEAEATTLRGCEEGVAGWSGSSNSILFPLLMMMIISMIIVIIISVTTTIILVVIVELLASRNNICVLSIHNTVAVTP